MAELAAWAPVTLAGEQLLPVVPALTDLLPGGGLQRGSTVSVTGAGCGATSLALALVAGPSAVGSWVASVGLPSLGLAAAVELGVAVERLVLVADPAKSWATTVATLLDAVDVVLVAPRRVGAADARRLVARARERGAVLVSMGRFEGADVRLAVAGGSWQGVGEGHGHLRARRVEVVVGGGRRPVGRERRWSLWLPDADGAISISGSCDEKPSVGREIVARTA